MNHPVPDLLHYSLPISALLVLLTILLVQVWPFTQRNAAIAEEKKLSAVYVYDSADVAYRDADAADIDQMFFSFALIKKGHVSGDHWEGIKEYQEYIAKHPTIQPILSIGGWGADGFSHAAATPKRRAAFVADTLELLQIYGFLGVDIDWEYPGSSEAGIASSPNDRDNYTLLLQAVRDGLDNLTAQDGKPRRLCIAVSGSPERIPNIDCLHVGEIVDQVNLMTYDMQDNNRATHHTPLYAFGEEALSADACVRAYADAGIPKEKIMLGIAFYGHRWTTGYDDPLGQPAKKVDTVPYTNIAKLVVDNPSAVHYDDSAQAPWFYDGFTFISYDDSRSIAQKSRYVMDNGLLGLFSWEYGADETGTLVRAMRQ